MSGFSNFCYWSYGNKKYSNKWQALYESHDPQKVKFHLFEDLFNNINTHHEPVKPLHKMYFERAQILREKYQYLRIFYSGGCDSHTMLQSFILQNIMVDEVVMFRCSPIGDFYDLANSEINLVAAPYIKSNYRLIKKVTFLDIGPQEFKKWYNQPDWFTNASNFKLRLTTAPHLYFLFPELHNCFEQAQSYCDLWGGEKPIISLDESGNYWAWLYDGRLADFLGSDFVEQFYISNEYPEIYIKQSHVIKNIIKEENPKNNNVFRYSTPGYEEFFRAQEKLRFPLFINHSLGKGLGPISIKNELAMTQARQNNNLIYENYVSTLKQASQKYPLFFNSQNAEKNYIGIKSNMIFLGS